jgi:PAS domain S-box-containing protein
MEEKKRIVYDQSQTAENPDEWRYKIAFERCPVSLWEEDISELRVAMKEVEKQDVVELEQYLEDHPEFIRRAAHLVKVVNVNSAAMRLCEVDNTQALLGPLDGLLDIGDPFTLSNMKNEILAVAAGREHFEHEAIVLTRQGRRVDTLVKAYIPHEDDDCPFMIVSAQDITDRKTAEATLAAKEESYRFLTENSSDIIARTDENFRITYVSSAVERTLGYNKAEIEGRLVWDFVSSSTREYFERRALERRESVDAKTRPAKTLYEIPFKRKDGGFNQTEGSISPLFDPNDNLTGYLAVVRDIADRKKAERALQESEEKFRIAFQANPEAINLNRLSDGTYLDINEGFTRLMGYSREEVIGRTSLELSIWVDPADREHLVIGLNSGGRVDDLRAQFRRKNGEIGIGVMSARILSIGGQRVILSLTRDITAEVELEERYRQAQKMEAVGRLAGGVAHDFNNILTAIGGYAELVRERIDEAGLPKDEIKEIVAASKRGATLVAQLLAFSRKQVLQPRVISINGVITDITNLLLRLIGEDIELMTCLQADVGKVKLDKGQIDQILMNLAANARDAMPKGGKLTIETSNVELGEQYCREHAESDPGDYVLLSVSDTGMGMERETLQRAFEPFFTTKPGKGTGLGLAMVYGIVKQSGGHIYAYSELGVGTTFKIYFPRIYEDYEVSEKPVPEVKGVRGTETILIVEDDVAIRKYCMLVLNKAGYKVIEATSATQALELLGRESVHLVLTDVVMPQMSGQQLAQRIKENSSNTRILFMSGYTENAIVHHGVLDAGVDLLPKPFGSRDLLRRIREVLSR